MSRWQMNHWTVQTVATWSFNCRLILLLVVCKYIFIFLLRFAKPNFMEIVMILDPVLSRPNKRGLPLDTMQQVCQYQIMTFGETGSHLNIFTLGGLRSQLLEYGFLPTSLWLFVRYGQSYIYADIQTLPNLFFVPNSSSFHLTTFKPYLTYDLRIP